MLKLSIKKFKKVKAKARAKAKIKAHAKAKARIKTKIFFVIFLIIIFFLNNISNFLQNIKLFPNVMKQIKRVGVVNIVIDLNIGNILVKYSMFKILEEMGFNATIIIPPGGPKFNTSFANRTIGSHLFFARRDFSNLKEEDFDYLMVNSDQTWAGLNLNVGFLKFAENWNVKKFIYAASAGGYKLPFREYNKILIKSLLRNFTGISFREKGMVKLLEDSIGLKSEFVLDPTFLLNKNVYLKSIKNYRQYNFSQNDKFIFIYQLDRNYYIEKTI